MSNEDYPAMCLNTAHAFASPFEVVFATRTDACWLYWCEDCRHRGQLLDWGARHNWPEIAIHPYAVASGMDFWQTAVLLGSDDMIWMFLGLIEMLDMEIREEAKV